MQGSDAQSMESQIAGLFQDIDTLKKIQKTMEKKSVIFTRDWKQFSRRSVL